MFRMFKGLFKTAVIATGVLGAVAGGALLVAGPARAKAVVHQMQASVLSSIDDAIEDPVRLRAELQKLEREYPKRIASVRKDLAELNEQVRQLERERAISERVVAMAHEDLVGLEPKVQAALDDHTGTGRAQLAAIVFDDHVYSFQLASSKVRQLKQIVVAHQNRAADAKHDLTYLTQQTARFEELLGQLEAERAQFQTQIFQLSRQVDSIQRNENLIALLEKRKRSFEQVQNFDVSTLEQLTGRLEMIRTRQEAELDHLSAVRDQVGYEDMARAELEADATAQRELEHGPSVLAPALGR
jgi:septal ring factor EnvC (AmiA/AmiB activator)